MNAGSDVKTVLVVDDIVANLDLIISFLSDKKYKTLIAKDGEKAIQRAIKTLPDLILLDIQMPGIDGFETCRRLKDNSFTADIPVIFMTALAETTDKLRGFEVGGVDYVTKPINCTELLARVDTHISLYRSQKALVERNRLLEENTLLKESMDQILRHDLKSPLSGLIMIPQVLLKSQNLEARQVKLLETLKKTALNMLHMINKSMDIYKMEKDIYITNFKTIDIISVINEVISIINASNNNRGLLTEIKFNGELISSGSKLIINSEEMLLYSLFNNLIKNAYEASSGLNPIEISIKESDNISITITNDGAVPEGIRDTFFNKYVTKGKDSGTGLGTYSAKLIIKTLKGSIKLDSSMNNRTSIAITLPK